MEARIEWRKIASVTHGGKPNFYHGFNASGERVAAVVWNRLAGAYCVETCVDGVWAHVRWSDTLPEARKAAVSNLSAFASAEGVR